MLLLLTPGPLTQLHKLQGTSRCRTPQPSEYDVRPDVGHPQPSTALHTHSNEGH